VIDKVFKRASIGEIIRGKIRRRRARFELSLSRLQKFFRHIDPAMRTMARLLRTDQAPARIMEMPAASS